MLLRCTVLLLAVVGARAQHDPTLGLLTHWPAEHNAADPVRQPIPRIIHQSYLPNEAKLEELSSRPRSHFRRDWRRSCQIHNPGYTYSFWNESRANAFIAEHYPDMVAPYNSVSRVVLQSDALRYMILDKIGGVWMDIDTECFAPLEPILTGYHFVGQAEWNYQLCNSHIASAPGHPVFRKLMDWFKEKAALKIRDPLKHTGPVALTTLIKAHIQPSNPGRSMGVIGGEWIDPLYKESKFRAYGLQEEWFLPCRWAKSYMSDCQAQLARSKSIARQLANGVNVSLELVRAGTTSTVAKLVKTAQSFARIRGSHEYANSWTTWAFADGLKSAHRAQEALRGLQPFFTTQGLFEEYSGWVPGGCGTSLEDVAAREQGLCGRVLAAAAAQGACHVLSVRGRVEQQKTPNTTLPLLLETMAADKYGCNVTVITLHPRLKPQVFGRVVIKAQPMQLGSLYDQYASPAMVTLTHLLDLTVGPGKSVTLLHIDCGADCDLWDVINQQPLAGLLALRRVGSLLVDLPPLGGRRRHMLNTIYQHLYQEIGLVGYHWSPGTSGSFGTTGSEDTGQAVAAGMANADLGAEAHGGKRILYPLGRMGSGHERLIPALRLGFVRVL